MPKISEFYGIIITMFWDEHPPPHFHARYGEHKAQIAIHQPHLLKGYLPPKALGLVLEWAEIHQIELEREWQLAMGEQPLFKIDPLK